MKTKKTYILPETELVMLNTRGKMMQDTLQDHFSGGDPQGTGIVIGQEGDDSDDDNRANSWTNRLWEEI